MRTIQINAGSVLAGPQVSSDYPWDSECECIQYSQMGILCQTLQFLYLKRLTESIALDVHITHGDRLL